MELRQVSLYPSGSQRWTSRLLHSTPTHLIYASTLALYVIDLTNYHLDILTGHENSISGLIPCDDTNSLVATSALDQSIRVWDLKRRIEVNRISTTDGSANFQPLDITWNPNDHTNILACGRRGALRLYNFNSRKYVYHKLGIDQDILHVEYNPKHPEYVFCVSADSTTIVYNIKKKSVLTKFHFSSSKLMDFAWDPLSDYYMLVAYEDGKLTLVDTSATSNSNFLIKSFEPDCRGLGAVSWLRSEPGNFLTGDLHNGMLRVWNVAQSEPSKRFKVKKSGIRFFKVLAGDDTKNSKSSSSTAKDDRLAISFIDGSVGIYNRKQREMEYITLPGHTETIFDCAFCEQDPNLFATSSYDGNVKIWNVKTQKCIENLLGEENTVIYSLSWHPNSMHIAGAVGNGTIWIWDSSTGRVLHRHKMHSSQYVYKVAWNQLDPSLLASTSRDRTCCVFREDGKLIKQFKHPNTVFGVDWCPSSKNIVATGCHDGIVRVFDISRTENAPIQKLKGHTSGVFNVKWHPIFPNVLMSGSNDNTVRVWNLDAAPGDASFCKVLKGHENNVRALAWNPELPHVALSGSWDGTIRVWDVKTEETISVVPHHHADVYGLSVHPKRPFIYGSSSRDTTIRFWTLESLFKDMVLKSVLSKSLAPVLSANATSPFAETPSSPIAEDTERRVLCGAESQSVQQSLKMLDTDVEKYERIFNFFSFPESTNDLWSLAVASVNGASRYGTQFTHTKQLRSNLESSAQELESIRMQKYGGGLGSASKEEQLKSAAKIYLSLGNMLKYCDIMAEIGEWNTALAVAPSVSIKYWKQLVARYVSFMREEDQSADMAPFLTSIGESDELIKYYTSRRLFKQAGVAALSQAQNALPQISDDASTNHGTASVGEISHPTAQMLKVSAQRAEHHLKLAQPISAACCYLALDDYQQTIRCLMKGDETLHAYAIAQVTGLSENDDIYTSMANICEKFSLWDLGVDMLKQVKDRNAVAQFMCTVSEKSTASAPDMEKRFLRAGIQAPSFYESQAKEFAQSNPSEAIRFHALAKQHQEAADLANQQFDALFGADTWNWKSIEECMYSAQCINATAISEPSRWKLLSYANFIGMQRALWKGYYRITPSLIHNARHASRQCAEDNSIVIPKDYMDYMLCVCHSKVNKVEALTLISQVEETQLSEELTAAMKDLKARVEAMSSPMVESYRNVVIPSGSTLPTRALEGGRTQSYITKEEAGAPLVRLDNGSVIALSEAIMWSDVNKFSPTLSGEKLYV